MQTFFLTADLANGTRWFWVGQTNLLDSPRRVTRFHIGPLLAASLADFRINLANLIKPFNQLKIQSIPTKPLVGCKDGCKDLRVASIESYFVGSNDKVTRVITGLNDWAWFGTFRSNADKQTTTFPTDLIHCVRSRGAELYLGRLLERQTLVFAVALTKVPATKNRILEFLNQVPKLPSLPRAFVSPKTAGM